MNVTWDQHHPVPPEVNHTKHQEAQEADNVCLVEHLRIHIRHSNKKSPGCLAAILMLCLRTSNQCDCCTAI